MVIADTSVWIPFFNRPDSPEKATLDILIDADEIALVGVVLAGCCRAVGQNRNGIYSPTDSPPCHTMKSLDPPGLARVICRHNCCAAV